MRRRWIGALLALVVVFVVMLALRPDSFARTTTMVTMARQTVIVGIAAVGMTLVIVLGGIDLSVGSTVAFSSVVAAKLLHGGHGAMAAVSGAIVTAAVIGLLNGALVAHVRLLPFIVTLGTMSIVRGAAKGLADEQKIDAPVRGLDALLAPLPPERAWMLLPPGVWIALAVAAVAAVVLHGTRFGRHVFAIGSNEQTARLCGVGVERTKIAVYAIAGLLAGLAGVMAFSTLTVGDPTTAVGLELDVIAAVVIGGASLAGGEGSIVGAVIGACLMTVVKTGATHVGLPNWVQEIVTGGIILVAAALDRLRHR
ncbi:MAG: ABC transporter permease [Deltaproteobacteria bacterium]|nr:ABC transporter permease [Deltaproteobacteria bacterium]